MANHPTVTRRVFQSQNPLFTGISRIGRVKAVRILLVRVAAEKALPFEMRVPNRTTVKAMAAADRGKGKRFKSAEALIEDLGI